ncbi:hypothetical protein [Peromfec virus RodF8_38]|uniref:Uncharacterized protein n=1 Tax=Peromfec virus RodF8_38 TaxID=2929373 RepID=A0A976R5H7_9VIRU|nr:hypothetical protein [Peromfec virus RodF8_38]
MLDYLEYIILGLAVLGYVVHFLVTLVFSIKNNRKITKLCDKCNIPIVEGEEHDCSLSSEQLLKLVDFVKSLKDGNDNG